MAMKQRDYIREIKHDKRLMVTDVGIMPNRLLMSDDVYAAIVASPEGIEAFPDGNIGMLWGLPIVRVPGKRIAKPILRNGPIKHYEGYEFYNDYSLQYPHGEFVTIRE